MKFTSGGIDRGARPICDGRVVEAENGRAESGNAGRRKEGMVWHGVDVIARSTARVRAVQNMLGVEMATKLSALTDRH